MVVFTPVYFAIALLSNIGVISALSLKGYAVFIALNVIFHFIVKPIVHYIENWNSTRHKNVNGVIYYIMIGFSLIALIASIYSWPYLS